MSKTDTTIEQDNIYSNRKSSFSYVKHLWPFKTNIYLLYFNTSSLKVIFKNVMFFRIAITLLHDDFASFCYKKQKESAKNN